MSNRSPERIQQLNDGYSQLLRLAWDQRDGITYGRASYILGRLHTYIGDDFAIIPEREEAQRQFFERYPYEGVRYEEGLTGQPEIDPEWIATLKMIGVDTRDTNRLDRLLGNDQDGAT